ncbi:MAG: NUDIX hydrolase [Paracoccaceae bacterium]
MTDAFKRAWTDLVLPILQRPRHVQVAALCHRKAKGGGREVLLVTSRDTGRWVLPKGWPIDGMNASESALQEAWEEAGVSRGDVSVEPLGSYAYEKYLKDGLPLPITTLVFAVKVRDMSDDFPEAAERRRKWVTPAKAATMVREPDLQQLIAGF